MSERKHKLHYFLDIGALTFGEFVVTEGRVESLSIRRFAR
jgi:hypothetical protein